MASGRCIPGGGVARRSSIWQSAAQAGTIYAVCMADGRFTVGDHVQTGFGKGTVREVRNGGRLLVEVQGRLLSLAARDLTLLEPPRPFRPPSSRDRPRPLAGGVGSDFAEAANVSGLPEVDLHGLTVEQAVSRLDAVLNQALLSGVAELRIIHGRSGGRIKQAVHARLGEIGAVTGFHLDPRNPGVTLVRF